MWQIHCAKNTLKSVLPFQRQLRNLKRRVVGRTHSVNGTAYDGGLDQIFFLRDAGIDVRDRDVLEIGSGWFPVIPLMMRLAGARHVVLTDAHALLDLDTLNATIEFLLERKAEIAEKLGIPVAEIERYLRTPEGADLHDALAKLGMSYAVPFDYEKPERQVDIVISHTVFEHIPPAVIESLLRDSRRVLRPGGVISHGIDHSDHRANVDHRLSRIDFLRYSDTMWKLLCIDPQDYTNRLRHSDYVQMMKAAGYELVFERAMINADSRRDLPGIPLAQKFRSMDADDLATLWSLIIARQHGAASA